jgi:hypothetical protein
VRVNVWPGKVGGSYLYNSKTPVVGMALKQPVARLATFSTSPRKRRYGDLKWEPVEQRRTCIRTRVDVIQQQTERLTVLR